MGGLATKDATLVMRHAHETAGRLGSSHLQPEHLLLGLLRLVNCIAATVLDRLQIDRQKMITEIEELAVRGPVSKKRLPVSPATRAAVENALEESRIQGVNLIEAEHLLLGILRLEMGVTAEVLKKNGRTEENVRQEILAMLEIT